MNAFPSTDPFTASLVILTAWWSVVTVRYPTYRRGLILGLFISLMLMGKVLAIPALILPFAAIFMLARGNIFDKQRLIQLIKTYQPYLLRAGAIVLLIWGIIVGIYVIRLIVEPHVKPIVDYYLYRGLEYNIGVRDYDSIAVADEIQASNALEASLIRFRDGISQMWSPLLVILTFLSLPLLFYRKWRETLFLGGTIFAMWIPLIVVAGRLSTRYLTLVGHLCVILVAGGIWLVYHELQQRKQKFVAYIPIAAICYLDCWIWIPLLANVG